ncbi:restriction endonuclease [Microcella alkalica]|uniref:Restriction endonuclease type IV Mrr domain-containing protein n=1 Tax=Microcella alkalica TaxID=355930 RepID=A0A839E888_9MICO|nr:hypothetical protein [Microcella alkalica]
MKGSALFAHAAMTNLRRTLLTPKEIDVAVDELATIAVDAYRSGAIHKPTFEALDLLSLYTLNRRWRRIQQHLMSWELVVHRRHDPSGYSSVKLPRELSGYSRPVDDIFAATMLKMADEWRQGDGNSPADGTVLLPLDEDQLRNEILERIDSFLAPFEHRMEQDRKRHFAEQAAQQEAAIQARTALARSRPNPAPKPLPFGVSPRGAELLVVDWMRHLGVLDAEVTPERSDGGIDVTSASTVAQVKHYKGKVGVVEVRELFGVATSRGKRGYFFTSAGYTPEAISFAVATEMLLFVYSAELGTLIGATPQSTALL